VDPFAWLLPAHAVGTERVRGLINPILARGCPQDRLQEALRAAYWGAQRSTVAGVTARHREVLRHQQTALAKLEEALQTVLAMEIPGPAEMPGYLRGALSAVRIVARSLPLPAPARGGRPPGWRAEATLALAALGVHQAEARELLGIVAALVRAKPLQAGDVGYVRAVFRTPTMVREQLLRRLPIPPRFHVGR
jgi:hypothetical protein